jgi:hypothetical protein
VRDALLRATPRDVVRMMRGAALDTL